MYIVGTGEYKFRRVLIICYTGMFQIDIVRQNCYTDIALCIMHSFACGRTITKSVRQYALVVWLCAESVDRYCQSFYHPTQCLGDGMTDESRIARQQSCYCNVDLCNAVAVTRLTISSLVLSLVACKLMSLSYG